MKRANCPCHSLQDVTPHHFGAERVRRWIWIHSWIKQVLKYLSKICRLPCCLIISVKRDKNLSLVQKLLSEGAKPGDLAAAASYLNNYEIAKELLEKGADPNASYGNYTGAEYSRNSHLIRDYVRRKKRFSGSRSFISETWSKSK